MADIGRKIYELRLLDELADGKTFIHRLHPVVKLTVNIAYIVTVISFGKYEITGLLPFAVFPVLMMLMSEVPFKQIPKRLLISFPIVAGIAVFNPVFDVAPYRITDAIVINAGWISMISILLKYLLTVSAVIILVGSTGMTRIAYGLEALKVPGIFVTQILLMYRYIYILLEEALRLTRAFSLRSGRSGGIGVKAAGQLLGQLLIRTHDRAARIYRAMCQRGFQKEMNTGVRGHVGITDMIYAAVCMGFFITARYIDLTAAVGSLLT